MASVDYECGEDGCFNTSGLWCGPWAWTWYALHIMKTVYVRVFAGHTIGYDRDHRM